LTIRGEISVHFKLKSGVLSAVKGKVLVHPKFWSSLIVDSDHFLSNLEVSIVHVKVIKTHETLKKNEKGFLKGEFVLNLIE
jgi:hypothetical protein